MATASVTSPAGSRSIDEIRAEFPILERRVNGQPLAYLDNGATAQNPSRSSRRWTGTEREHNANVHRGVHTLSEEATEALRGRAATIAAISARPPREVIFVRNATEAINLVAHAWARANVGAGDRILLTEMEHHSNIVPWYLLAKRSARSSTGCPSTTKGAST